jgi:hypothetical protein
MSYKKCDGCETIRDDVHKERINTVESNSDFALIRTTKKLQDFKNNASHLFETHGWDAVKVVFFLEDG